MLKHGVNMSHNELNVPDDNHLSTIVIHAMASLSHKELIAAKSNVRVYARCRALIQYKDVILPV